MSFYAPDSLRVVKLLTDRGANVNARNSDSQSVLIVASFHAQPDVVRFLLSKGARLEDRDARGGNALMNACWQAERDRPPGQGGQVQNYPGDLAVVRMLVKHNANKNAKNKAGETPFSLARKTKDPALLRALDGG